MKEKSHDISVKGEDNFKLLIDYNEQTLYRNLSGRDYGIDGIVEVFFKRIPTGKICYIQLKTKSCNIEPLKRNHSYISCKGISDGSIAYTKQDKIPFFLVYNSLTNKNKFYYKLLNNQNIKTNSTIHISSSDYCEDDITKFIEQINHFYEQ